jgi:hypothetical protein
MSLFKTHTVVFDVPIDKAQAVLEKITGEYGKLIRDSYDKHPFTGTVTKEKFRLIPNLPGASVKLKGTIQSEAMNKTRMEVSGTLMFIKVFLFLFVGITMTAFFSFLIYMFFTAEGFGAITLVLLFLPALFLSAIFFKIFGFPKSNYNNSLYVLMRKIDNHEVVI